MHRDAPAWQQGGGNSAAAVVVAAAAPRERLAWQRGSGVKLGSEVAAFGLAAQLHIAASSGHGRTSHYQYRAATARCRGGDEDTSGDSNGGGTNNQQST